MSHLTEPIQLSPHVFIVYSEFPHVDSGNVYLVTGKRPALIDCGSQRAVPQIVDNLSQLGLRVADIDQVIATHGDYDHVQGYHILHALNPDLQLHIHWRDRSTVQEDNAYMTASYVYGQPFIRFNAEQCLPLNDGDVISVGDTALTVHHTPGHTEGSVCFLGRIDDTDILFAGDAIGGAMRSLDGASLEIWARAMATWRSSLRHISDLTFDWVLNGHEPAANLPLTRSRVDRLVAQFGTMMNPWFLLGEAEPVPVRQP